MSRIYESVCDDENIEYNSYCLSCENVAAHISCKNVYVYICMQMRRPSRSGFPDRIALHSKRALITQRGGKDEEE